MGYFLYKEDIMDTELNVLNDEETIEMLTQALQAAKEENDMLKEQLKVAKEEIATLKNQVDSINSKIEDIQVNVKRATLI